MSLSKNIILIGAGHVNLHVAARARVLIEQGARVILIDPGVFWYSGMATGMLGGRYEAAEDQLDPKLVIEAAGGEFYRGRVTAVEPEKGRVKLADGNEMIYDYLSINVGSRVKSENIRTGAEDASVWPVKPIANLQKFRAFLESRFRMGEKPRLAVVGGGSAGVEMAANLKALGRRFGINIPVALIAKSERVLPAATPGASRSLRRNLIRNGINLHCKTKILEREGKSLIADGGNRIEADYVVLATGLQAQSLVHSCNLPTGTEGGLLVDSKLQSVGDNRIFAGGDCAEMEGDSLPNIGVFGVRQAAYIHTNLLASLENRQLAEYKPQKKYLAILNLGDKTGFATWGKLWWKGRLSMKLKDFIDQRFLNSYRSHFA